MARKSLGLDDSETLHHLVNETNESQGIAFCEFADPSVTDIAMQGLNDMVIGEKKLRVQKASIGITQVSGVEMGVNAMSMLAGTTASGDAEMSRVVQLLNMVTPEELIDNDDYEGKFSLRFSPCGLN